MRIVSYRHQAREGFGKIVGDDILCLDDVNLPDLKSALARGVDLETLPSWASISLIDATLLPVIPNPGKIFCVGHNYEDHRIETGRERVGHPSIFTRFADTLIGHGAPIVQPSVSTMLDYEGELAVVIGAGGRNIAADRAMAHIAGFACGNDVSVRDWQRHTQQFTPGKNFPGTGGLGPALVTSDEVGELAEIRLTTFVNEVVVQDARLDQMIFPIPVIIAYISVFTLLSPGDVILTGTPGGVGARREPPLWLKPGDNVTVEIGKIGSLSNPVIAEPRPD